MTKTKKKATKKKPSKKQRPTIQSGLSSKDGSMQQLSDQQQEQQTDQAAGGDAESPFVVPDGQELADVNPNAPQPRRYVLGQDAPKPGESTAKTLFGDADVAEADRQNNQRIGLLIGPKNLEKLRVFGYDVVKVSDGPLTPGVAHRGMTT